MASEIQKFGAAVVSLQAPFSYLFQRFLCSVCVQVSLVREEMPAVRSELPRALQVPGEGLQPAGNKIQASF